MAAMDCEEQSAAQAESVKGDETVAPLPGLLTWTPANAEPAQRVRIEPLQNSLRKTLIGRTPVQENGRTPGLHPKLRGSRAEVHDNRPRVGSPAGNGETPEFSRVA